MSRSIPKLAMAALLAASLSASAAPAAEAAPTDPWNLVWSDEFNGANGSAPDAAKWSYDIGTGINGGWGNNERQYYTDSRKNSYIQDGRLVIKALAESYGGRNYTSARLVTRNKGDWTYGRMVVRAKLPAGNPTQLQGIWPAIWMLPTDNVYGTWPVSGEIDIMEMVGRESTSSSSQKVWGTLHFGNPWKYINSSYTITNNSTNQGFHEYAVEWDPDQIRWYVDSQLFQTRSASEWYSSGAPSPAPFNQRFHLLLNLAVGGDWPGDPTASTVLPQTMEVDYVRVYQRPASSGIVSGANYKLINVNSGKALDVYSAGTANGTNVDVWTDNGTGAQQWQALSNGDGTFRLVNLNSGKALDVAGAGTADGTNVAIWEVNGSAAQKWQFVANADGTYKLINPNSGKALDVAGAGTGDGTNVQIAWDNGSAAQKWRLVRL
ncbi:beta-glucanase (GH16 family) [Paenibacillus mucilaginosus]|uniref:RICIN domain-containing protein n=1 Tax=Paenibacillus mucilaginosus TaxID=61624 RepID=UPI003D24DD63